MSSASLATAWPAPDFARCVSTTGEWGQPGPSGRRRPPPGRVLENLPRTGELDFSHDLQGRRIRLPDDSWLTCGSGWLQLRRCSAADGQPRGRSRGPGIIAPTIGKHDYASFQSVQTPLFVVASEDDFATDVEQLETWLASLTMPRQLVPNDATTTSFAATRPRLVEVVSQFLNG